MKKIFMICLVFIITGCSTIFQVNETEIPPNTSQKINMEKADLVLLDGTKKPLNILNSTHSSQIELEVEKLSQARQKGDIDAALEGFHGLDEKYPKNPVILSNLGSLEILKGDTSKGEEIFYNILGFNINDEVFPRLLLEPAIALFDVEDYEASLGMLKELDHLYVENSLVKYWIARNYLYQGKNDLALKLYQRSIELSNEEKDLYNIFINSKIGLAMSYYKLGNIADSRKSFNEVLQIEADNSIALRWLEKIASNDQ